LDQLTTGTGTTRSSVTSALVTVFGTNRILVSRAAYIQSKDGKRFIWFDEKFQLYHLL